MLLAEFNLLEHIVDHPWQWDWCRAEVFGMKVTLMSSGIAEMIFVAVLLPIFIIPLARRRQEIPSGGKNVLEVVVVFVRDMIARPALHEKAYDFLPFLLTLFVFVLGVNVFGILPIESISVALGLPRMGMAATAIPTVCAALASLSLMAIVFSGLKHQTLLCRKKRGWSLWVCGGLSPLLWLVSLSPRVPGVTGKIILIPMTLLELIGVIAKCFALMIRLFANMISGHVLLAVLMYFVMIALEAQIMRVFYVGPFCVAAGVVVDVMELLVSGLQAYIFTFLTAMFLGLYVEPAH